MKNNYYLAILILLISLTSVNVLAQDLTSDRGYKNGECNFFVSDFCFKLFDGDAIKVSRKLDFYLYDLEFKSGIKIKIYLGYHPKVEPYVDGYQKPCDGEDECYLFLDYPKGEGYLVYLESENEKKYPKYVHMMFNNVNLENKNELDSFINNIRKCKTKQSKTVCEKDIWGKKLPK